MTAYVLVPSEAYNTVSTLDGRTVVVRADDQDLHPAVRRSMAVKDTQPIKSYGAATHSNIVPLRAEI